MLLIHKQSLLSPLEHFFTLIHTHTCPHVHSHKHTHILSGCMLLRQVELQGTELKTVYTVLFVIKCSDTPSLHPVFPPSPSLTPACNGDPATQHYFQALYIALTLVRLVFLQCCFLFLYSWSSVFIFFFFKICFLIKLKISSNSQLSID